MIPPLTADVLVALLGAVRIDVTLLAIAGVLAVAGALLNLDARNKRYAARADRDEAAWLYREAHRLGAPISLLGDGYGPEPTPDEDEAPDATELGDAVEEPEPTRPLFYRRRHKLTVRHRLERWEARRPFDIADGWDEQAAAPALDETADSAPELPPVAASTAADAEGFLTETEAEFRERVERDLDSLFGRHEPVGAGAR